jgi:hypothetical protein
VIPQLVDHFSGGTPETRWLPMLSWKFFNLQSFGTRIRRLQGSDAISSVALVIIPHTGTSNGTEK